MRVLCGLTLALTLGASTPTAHEPVQESDPRVELPDLDRKAARELGRLVEDWFDARPATRFDAWDPEARAALVERARALGPLPHLMLFLAAPRKIFFRFFSDFFPVKILHFW